jgi:hypothetical protein
MIVCNRCGKENQNHYKFCLGCGAELTAAAPAAPAGAADSGGVGMMKTMMADTSMPVPQARPTGVGQAQAPQGAYGARPSGPAPAPTPGGFGGPPAVSAGWGTPPAGGLPGMPPVAAPPPPMMGAATSGPMGKAGMPQGAPPAAAPAPAAATAGRNCGTCGAEVPPNFRFCGACGSAIAPPEPVAPVVRSSMTLIRPDGSEGGTVTLQQGENLIGRNHGSIFESDGYLSPTHAAILVNGTEALVRDLDSLNGVFVRMSGEEELQPGQIIRLGQELLRYDALAAPAPLEDGTEVMGSPNPGYWGKITVMIGRHVDGSAYPLFGDSVALGRERGDINFPDDGYVSGLHARIAVRGGKVFLADLGSSNGTFVKIARERGVGHESYVLLGQQLFRLSLT